MAEGGVICPPIAGLSIGDVGFEGFDTGLIVSDSDEIAARSGSEGRDVAAQSGVFAGMTVLSRLSGLARDTALAHFVGATGAADTFYLAFRIPNFFRRLFAESTFALAFVPVLSEYRERGSQAALRAFVAAVSGNFLIVLLLVTLIGVAGAGLLAALFMPGFLGDPERFALATDLTRIMFPYMALISLTAFAGAILNSANRFAVQAFTPVLLNVALVAAAFWAATGASAGVSGIAYALAWGVLAGGAAQLLFNLPSVARTGLLVAPRPNWRHEGVAKVFKLLVPAVFAGSAYQVNALIGTMLASLLEEGSPSWLYYADRLWEVPIGIVAIALGTVLLPNLSRLHTAGDSQRFNDTLDWGVRTGILLGIPAAVALWVLAYPLVATIFLHGEMRPYDADRSAAALRAFAIGLVPLILVKVAVPGFFSRQDSKTPLRFAVAATVVNVAISLATFWWLGHVGLALATSVAGIVNAGLLLGALIVGRHYRPGRRLARTTLVALFGTAAMGAALVLGLPDDASWSEADHWLRIGWLGLAVVGGLVVYALAVLAGGIRPHDLRHRA